MLDDLLGVGHPRNTLGNLPDFHADDLVLDVFAFLVYFRLEDSLALRLLMSDYLALKFAQILSDIFLGLLMHLNKILKLLVQSALLRLNVILLYFFVWGLLLLRISHLRVYIIAPLLAFTIGNEAENVLVVVHGVRVRLIVVQ